MNRKDCIMQALDDGMHNRWTHQWALFKSWCFKGAYNWKTIIPKNKQTAAHGRCAKSRKRLTLHQRTSNKSPTYFSATTILNNRLVSSSTHQPKVFIHIRCLTSGCIATARDQNYSAIFSVILFNTKHLILVTTSHNQVAKLDLWWYV